MVQLIAFFGVEASKTQVRAQQKRTIPSREAVVFINVIKSEHVYAVCTKADGLF